MSFLTDCICIDGEEGWFILTDKDILCKLDLFTGNAAYVSDLPVKNADGFRQHSLCFLWNERVFCLPMYSGQICIYDKNNRTWTTIDLNGDKVQVDDYNIEGNKLYISSRGNNTLYCIDLENDSIENTVVVESDPDIDITSCIDAHERRLFVGLDNLYSMKKNDESILCTNLSIANEGFNTVCTDGDNAYITGKYGSIYIVDKDMILKMERCFPEGFGRYNYGDTEEYELHTLDDSDRGLFLKSYCTNYAVWFIPFSANMIVYYDLLKRKLFEFKIDEVSIKNKSDLNKFKSMASLYLTAYFKDSRYIGLITTDGRYLIEIDGDNMTYRTLCLNYDRVIKEAKLFYLNECSSFKLDDFMRVL